MPLKPDRIPRFGSVVGLAYERRGRPGDIICPVATPEARPQPQISQRSRSERARESVSTSALVRTGHWATVAAALIAPWAVLATWLWTTHALHLVGPRSSVSGIGRARDAAGVRYVSSVPYRTGRAAGPGGNRQPLDQTRAASYGPGAILAVDSFTNPRGPFVVTVSSRSTLAVGLGVLIESWGTCVTPRFNRTVHICRRCRGIRFVAWVPSLWDCPQVAVPLAFA